MAYILVSEPTNFIVSATPACKVITLNGGRQYRRFVRRGIDSRDKRHEELGHILRVIDDVEFWDEDDDEEEPCCRSIYWLLAVDPDIQILNIAQQAIKHNHPVDSPALLERIKLWRHKLERRSHAMARMLSAEYEGFAALLGPPAMDFGTQSGPSPSRLWTEARKSRQDTDFERWHLLQACIAICLRLQEIPLVLSDASLLNDPRYNHWNKSFIVVGWFQGRQASPHEACMWYFDEKDFLSALRRQIHHLRGWRRWVSLKSVKAFGLYKECDLKHRCHVRYECSPREKVILAQLYSACWRKSLRGHDEEPIEWADWVQMNLNNNYDSKDGRLLQLPFQCHRSLHLIIKWSKLRLVIASLIPLLLSLGIGFYFQFAKDDAQTAYTIASYILTTGGFLIAILAILTQLDDGSDDLGWHFTGSSKARSNDCTKDIAHAV